MIQVIWSKLEYNRVLTQVFTLTQVGWVNYKSILFYADNGEKLWKRKSINEKCGEKSQRENDEFEKYKEKFRRENWGMSKKYVQKGKQRTTFYVWMIYILSSFSIFENSHDLHTSKLLYPSQFIIPGENEC